MFREVRSFCGENDEVKLLVLLALLGALAFVGITIATTTCACGDGEESEVRSAKPEAAGEDPSVFRPEDDRPQPE